MHKLFRAALVAVAAAASVGAQPRTPEIRVELKSAYFAPGVPLAESGHPVHAVHIEARVDAKGEGKGRLTLMVTPPNYDEYGDLVTGTETDLVDRTRRNGRPPVVLDCAFEFVRSGAMGRVNERAYRRSVYRVIGPEIESPLFFATAGPGLTSGRLLVHDKDGRVEYVIELAEVKPPKEGVPAVPCHPGCFPAGTPVLVPGGTVPIERLRPGDAVTAVAPDGGAARGVVEDVFTTTNHLVRVRTDAGDVLTTFEQPLVLAAGGFRRAGDLKPGDRVGRWRDGRRAEAVVKAVAPAGREAPVFNLILGDSAVFVAGDFLARGKPPAAAPVSSDNPHSGHPTAPPALGRSVRTQSGR
jgi:hypothetical protein